MTDAEEALERKIDAARQWMEEAYNDGDIKSAKEWAIAMRDLIAARSTEFVAEMEKRLGLR